MAWLDWSQCPVAESIPGKISGAWVFRDTRTPVPVVQSGGLTVGPQVFALSGAGRSLVQYWEVVH